MTVNTGNKKIQYGGHMMNTKRSIVEAVELISTIVSDCNEEIGGLS